MFGLTLPVWLEGTLAGMLVLVLLGAFVLPIARLFNKKTGAEGTLATEVVAQLKATNEALAAERADSLASERQLRAAHAEELVGLRDAHAAERKAAAANATVLQARVLDLSSKMVDQARENAATVVATMEKVRAESREGLQKLSAELEETKRLNADCERRHHERDRVAEERRRADDDANRKRDEKLETLMLRVLGNTTPASVTVNAGTTAPI